METLYNTVCKVKGLNLRNFKRQDSQTWPQGAFSSGVNIFSLSRLHRGL